MARVPTEVERPSEVAGNGPPCVIAWQTDVYKRQDGLVISNGFVNTTSISVGNNAHGIMYLVGGTVTNTGTLTLKNSTVTRPARFVQAGGFFITPDPNLVVMNPSGGGDTVYGVIGGMNMVGGFQFGSGANAGIVYFTNAASIYVGSQGIVSNGAVTLNTSLNNGGIFGATTNWTGSAAMKLTGGTFTFLSLIHI